METKTESNEDYHSNGDWLSASMLKDLLRSPRIFEAKHVDKTLMREATAAFEIGTAVHCAALEPARFADEYVVQPPEANDRRTKAYKEWAKTVDPAKSVLRQQDAETVARCVDSLRSVPLIKTALDADGAVELSHYWADGSTGVPCKCRPDKIVPSAGIVLDIKTMAVCSPRDFIKDAMTYHYGIQAAHYLDGAESHYGFDDWLFVFACVEKSEPYRRRAICLDGGTLDRLIESREALLIDYKRRVESGDWSETYTDETGQEFGEQDLIPITLPGKYLERV